MGSEMCIRDRYGPARPSRVAGWCSPTTAGASRVASNLLCIHAVAITPAGPLGACVALLPQQRRPSPKFRWVGSRVIFFEACSAFTRVTACILAKSPCDHLHRRL